MPGPGPGPGARGYSLRDQPVRGRATTVNHLRLRRLVEHNSRLRDDLQRPRIRTSEASLSIIAYCTATTDPLIPSLWGRAEDPYALPRQKQCCCVQ